MGVSSTSTINYNHTTNSTEIRFQRLLDRVLYFESIVSCMKKQIDSLTTIVNNVVNIDKPPIYIPWTEFAGNKYLNNDLFDTEYVVMLNGVNILEEGVDYNDLTESEEVGGFELINSALLDAPNTYIVFR